MGTYRFCEACPLCYRPRAVRLQAVSLPVLTVARRATNLKGWVGYLSLPRAHSNPKSRTKKRGGFLPLKFQSLKPPKYGKP